MALKVNDWGSVRKYKPGVYYLRYPLPPDPVTGKRQQGFEKVTGSLKDANKRLAELRVRYDTSVVSGPSSLTISECWREYYRPYIDRLALSTIRGYESSYNANIEPAFGNASMESIRKAEIQRWLDGMTYGAARSSFAVLRAMYNFAYDNELIEKNVLDKKYNLPKKSDGVTLKVNDAIHDEKTLNEIFNLAKGEEWEAPFILSAFGGCRREEAFGVKWEDISFTNDYAVININKGIQFLDKEIKVMDLKTEESYRDAVIPMPYAERLKQIMEEHCTDVWICDDGFGNSSNPDRVSNAYKRWYLHQPYAYVPWKNLRVSYATMLHSRGVELGVIAKILGHTTPVITFKHYDRMDADTIASFVDVLRDAGNLS